MAFGLRHGGAISFRRTNHLGPFACLGRANQTFLYRRPQLLKKSLAAISPFSVFRASPPQAEMAWPAAASRSTEMAQRLGAQRARGMGQWLVARTVGSHVLE